MLQLKNKSCFPVGGRAVRICRLKHLREREKKGVDEPDFKEAYR